MTTIVWFRQDLRLADNPALAKAEGDVVPVYILDETNLRPRGGASRWWLHHSLAALRDDLGGLVIRKGDPLEIIPALMEETGADKVHWNRCYDPRSIARDRTLKEQLGEAAASFNAALLHEPWTVETQDGSPYKVFTPFWKAARKNDVPAPLDRPEVSLADLPESEGPDTLGLLPTNPNWAEGWDGIWTPGEAGAMARLDSFLDEGLKGYGDKRNRPDLPNVSRLSPHLAHGEIGPRQIKARTEFAAEEKGLQKDAQKFLSEIGWREFSYHLLYHFPDLPDRNWRRAFDAYPWRDSAEDLARWQNGRTGYPIVDAGMRELWQTGYMHNRVRMVVASFLVKHLRLHWSHGEAWFWDTLCDADTANNAASWQWTAGSGADAAPYFRIFNPMSQGEKFDPNGAYIRQYCPELADLPDKHLNAPWDAPADVLEEAGVTLGENWPEPIVDHMEARKAALAGYEHVKKDG